MKTKKLIGILGIFLVGFVIFISFASAEGLLWKVTSSDSYFDEKVAIGDYGQFVLNHYVQGNEIKSLLYSAYDSGNVNPIVEIVEDLPSGYFVYETRADSAKMADSQVVMHEIRQYMGGVDVFIKKFSSTSNNSYDWVYDFGVNIAWEVDYTDLAVDDYGDVIVGYVEIPNDNYALRVLDKDGYLIGNADGTGRVKAMRLSHDGEVLAVLHEDKFGNYEVRIYDDLENLNMTPIYTRNVDGLNSPWNEKYFGVNRDGSRVAFYDQGELVVLKKSGNHYDESVFNGVDCSGGLDFSGGEILVCAGDDVVKVFSLRDYTFLNELMSYEFDDGTSTSRTWDISISNDGQIFALTRYRALVDDEVYVFDSSIDEPIQRHLISITCKDIEVSRDGTKIVATGYSGNPDYERSINLFEVGKPQIKMVGVPRLGATILFKQPKINGALYNVFYSFDYRVSRSLYGLFYLKIGTYDKIFSTGEDNDFVLTEYQIPNDDSLVGKSIYFQGMRYNTRDLSDNYLKVRVLPA